MAQSEEQEASREAETSSRDRNTAEVPFLQSITTTAGPAAYYKENRASGVYKKASTEHTADQVLAPSGSARSHQSAYYLTGDMQDPKQESTILKLQNLYDSLKEAAKGQRRPSGLTLVDHAGTTQGHRAW